RHLLLEYPNGLTASVNSEIPLGFESGDVVLVNAANSRIDPLAPADWPDDPQIGVVRLRREDITVVDAGAGLVRLPTSGVAYAVGNTVEYRLSIGVEGVLSEKPLRYVDVGGSDDDLRLERFRLKPDPKGPLFENFGGFQQV